jgi:hypothetical protein
MWSWGMGKTAAGTRAWDWHRIWPALVTFVMPLLFLSLIMETTVHYVMPADRQIWPELDPDIFLPDPFARFTHDVAGRLLIGTASAFIQLASGACLLLALVLLVRKFGSWAGATIFVGSTVFGIAIGYWLTSQNIDFSDFLYTPIQLAQDADVVLPGTIERLKWMIMVNNIVGIGACGALNAAFSSVAVRAQPEELTAAHLQQRKNELELLFISASILLVLLIVVSKAELAWPRVLMATGKAESFGALAGALAGHWAASATGVLVCTGIPAVWSVRADIDSAAKAATEGTQTNNHDWRQKNHLEFGPMSVLASITAIAPLLTPAVIDVLENLLSGR